MTIKYFVGTRKVNTIVQMFVVKNPDLLPPDIHDYWGQRETTKKHLKQTSVGFLDYLKYRNAIYKDCTKIVIK